MKISIKSVTGIEFHIVLKDGLLCVVNVFVFITSNLPSVCNFLHEL